jgi:hypothetical protein
MEGDGFGFEKRSSAMKRALDQIEGDDFIGFRKRALDAMEGDGFGGFVNKRSPMLQLEEEGPSSNQDQQQFRQAIQTLSSFRRLRRALDALEGKGFGF